LELSFSDVNKWKLAVPRVRDLLTEVIRNALPEGDGVGTLHFIACNVKRNTLTTLYT
jgi:hypothetical protein